MKFSVLKYGMAFILPVLVISCFEEDEAVSPYPGNVILIENNINHYQSYFDFETGEVNGVHPINDWQLAFESGISGWHILVNSGAGWFLWNSHKQDIEAAELGIEPQNWNYDIQSEYPDSTAAGNWITIQNNNYHYTNDVYVLGQLSAGNYINRKRIQFIFVDSALYRFHYKEEDNGFSDTVTIVKSDSSAFIYYDFIQRTQNNLEPNYTRYDVVFCPYYDLATLFGVTIPYLVRGVLLNPYLTLAVLDSVYTYKQIDYELLNQYEFSDQRDAIGYRWKDVSVSTGSEYANYIIHRNYSYIIKTLEGNYYKMRFLSYSLNGESGYPQFEYSILNPVQ